MNGHDGLEYICKNQPKWIVRIFGERWYYCSDSCLSKHFQYTKNRTEYKAHWLLKIFGVKNKIRMRKIYNYYKKNPKAKFKLNLTKCYKMMNR